MQFLNLPHYLDEVELCNDVALHNYDDHENLKEGTVKTKEVLQSAVQLICFYWFLKNSFCKGIKKASYTQCKMLKNIILIFLFSNDKVFIYYITSINYFQ